MHLLTIAIAFMLSLPFQKGNCHGEHVAVQTNKTHGQLCTFWPRENKGEYEELTTGSAGYMWIIRYCQPESFYNVHACKCIECKPELWINFDGQGIRDSSGNNITIDKIGELLNLGYFDGNKTLNVSYYATQDFGQKSTVRVQFYSTGNTSGEQVLISNCIEGQAGSVEIALDKQSKEIIFKIEAKTDNVSNFVEIRQPYKEMTWTNVIMRYNGTALTAHVDGIPDVTVELTGIFFLNKH
ncbi:uncharacterized protein LOC132725136 [Ruditapes philippinarum]|uniref:uncharacterized protein LOC132725136 n=1 Tax=Ruditapes philippinarum TaxID=129788 RepID=UPI00295B9D61|nr:uncharacterized protein LOC132725136 [Ruditapes philippinarum]